MAGSLERAAKLGTGLMVFPLSMDRFREVLERLHTVADGHGRDISEIDILMETPLNIASTREEAIRLIQPQFRSMGIPADSDAGVDLQRGLIGTPDDILERIGEYEAAGLQHCMINRIAGETLEEKLEQTRMLVADVLPLVKGCRPGVHAKRG